ncbi:hypothetical protein B5S28_g4587 [[Candida] boidinii]|nr:hypothetical protein B5S28_g4587 [[Candida] boidinii]GME91499.1 unnamed protein product [[Candida] boidinii]
MTIKKSIFTSPFLYSKDEHEDLFKIDKNFKNKNKKTIKLKKSSNLLDDFQSGNTNLDDIFSFPSRPSSSSLTNNNESDLALSLNSSRSIISSTSFASPSSPPPNIFNRNDFSFQDYLNDFNLEHNITGCTPDLDFTNITKTTIVCSTDDENSDVDDYDSDDDDDDSCDSSCDHHNNNQTKKLNKKIKLDSSYRNINNNNKNDFLCESTFQDINSSNEKLTNTKDTNLVGDLLYDLSLDELDFQIRSNNKEESLDNKENQNDLISIEFNKNLKNIINNDDQVDEEEGEEEEESFDEFLQVENSFNDFEFENMIDANERQTKTNKNKQSQLKQNQIGNQAPFIYQDPEHEQGKLRQEINNGNNDSNSRIRLTDNMSDIFNDKLNHFDHNTEDYKQKQMFFKDSHDKSSNSSNSENYYYEDEQYESGTSDECVLNTGRYIGNEDDEEEEEEEEEELRLINNDNILLDLSSGSNSSGNVSSSGSFITRHTINFSNKPIKKSPGRVCSPSSSRKKIPTKSVIRVRKNLLNLIVDSSDGNLDDATKYATEINSQNCEGIPIPEKTTELVTIPTAGPQIGGIKKAAIVKAILAKSGNKHKHKKLHHHTHTHTHNNHNHGNGHENNVKGFYTLDEKANFIKETNEFFSNKLKDSKNIINITNNSSNINVNNSLKNLKEKINNTIIEFENQENSISDNQNHNGNNQLSPNKSPLVSPRSKQRHHSHQYNHQLQLKQQREQQLQLQQQREQQLQQRQRRIKSVKWANELEW